MIFVFDAVNFLNFYEAQDELDYAFEHSFRSTVISSFQKNNPHIFLPLLSGCCIIFLCWIRVCIKEPS